MNDRGPHKSEVGVEILPFDLGFLPPFYEKKAESEMNDVAERRYKCLKELRIMIIDADDDSISRIEFDDDFLLQHLRTRKFNVTKAFVSLNNFVVLTKKHPEMFSNFDFDITVTAIRNYILTMLPWRCHEGCAILYVQIRNWDLDSFPMDEVKHLLVVVLMQAMRDPMTQVNGIKVILDLQTFGAKLLRQCLRNNYLFLLYHATQRCVPGRYKGVHFVNSNILFQSVWLCLKQFMSQKLQSRIFFHSSTKKIFDFFPKAVIPKMYGGDLDVEDQSEWLRKVMTPEQLATIGGGALNPI